MKKQNFRRPISRAAARALCVLGASLAAFNSYAADAAPADDSANDETRNWIDFSVGGNFVNGDSAAFRERTQQPREVFGGVSDFHYEMDVGKKGLFEVDGRGIFDARDYDLRLKLSEPGKGYVATGYRQYSTYYDGSGGYSPGNGAFFDFWDDEMRVERSKFFFEAGLTLEEKPEIRIRYDYDRRDGRKDSTIWGESTATGVGSRKVAPAFYELDEDRHSIALDIAHNISNTRVGIGGRAEFSSLDNSRNMIRNALEVTQRFYTHRDGVDTDLYNARAWSDTQINDQWKLTTAYSFTSLDTDTSGFRSIGGAFGTDPSPVVLGNFGLPAGSSYPAGAQAGRQVRDHGYFDLEGGSRVDQHVTAINVMWKPTDHVTVVPSIRIEASKQRGAAEFEDYEVATPTGTTRRDVDVEKILNTRRREILDVTESIEARYTGMTNWVHYIRGEWLQGSGDLSENETFIDLGRTDIFRTTESTLRAQKYVVGSTWYPSRKVSTALQYYHRIRENDYDHVVDSSPLIGGGLYPAFIEKQNFDTDDVNFRITVRPLNQLTLVTRYDFQYSTILSQMGTLPEARSAKSVAHIITESITWSPLAWMYVQASGSYTVDRLSTPADFTISPQVLEVTRNNYYTAMGTVGFALSEKDDLTANYNYFLADNYNPGFITASVPYGASLEEHTIGAGWVHRFNKRLQLTTRYAFITSDNETSGGYDNFDAHMLSTTLRWRF
jgi:hypothetical protein